MGDSDTMRLLHVIASLDPAQGGPPVVVSRLAAAQRELGYQVSVLGYATSNTRRRIDSMLGEMPLPGPHDVHLLDPGTMLEQLRAGRARHWLHEHIDEFDLVHLHGVWDPILSGAARIARHRGVPWIITPHGMLDPWCMEQGRLKKQLALRTWVRPILQGARFIHALNEDESRGMASLIGEVHMETVPNGVFLEELVPPQEVDAFRNRHPQIGNDPFVLFLSRLHYKKGLDILVDAFELHAEQDESTRLVIAGPDDGYESTLRQHLRESKAGERVHLVGPLYGDAKCAALVEAGCFCLPSRQEGFSMAITEALGFGTPVIISRECHFPEVETAGAGLVVDLEPESVSNAVTQVLQDTSARDTMGRNGATLVREHYTWPSIAKRFDALFQEYNCS